MKEIRVGDTVHRFPDDATDDDINAALGGAKKPGVGQAVLTGLKEAVSPSGLMETAKSDFGPAIQEFRNPSPSTLLALSMGAKAPLVYGPSGLRFAEPEFKALAEALKKGGSAVKDNPYLRKALKALAAGALGAAGFAGAKKYLP